jgi:2-methylisocitrate lyase-like PEP mutase family enzyme
MRETRGACLRRLIGLRNTVAAPGVSDPFTARIVERAGFESVYLGGNAIGLSLAQGQPMITLTETVNAAANITRVIEAPLIVDAGAGFGEPAHVHRAVRELEGAGVAALHIDDQPYPKQPKYHRRMGGLVSVEAAVNRLTIAVRARRDPDCMIIARTDALRVTGSMDAVIERARAYAATGIDGLMVLDLGPADLVSVRSAIPDLPIIWIGGVIPPTPNLAALNSSGFAIALYPFNTVAAIADAVTALWAEVRTTGDLPQSPALLGRMRDEMQHIIGMQTYWDIEDWIEARHVKT